MTRGNRLVNYVDGTLLAGLVAFLMVFFDVRYLLFDTVVTGGDTASWMGVANHLAEVLFPNGRLMGWDMGNFCGYPNFNFYFLPPFLLAVIPSKMLGIPLTITLKWSIMTGLFVFPVTTYFGLRQMRYRFPGPIMGAVGAVLFLFNESHTMFGANALSTFAGEFCYMLAFSLFAVFIGTFYRGSRENRWSILNGMLLGLIGLSHLFVFIPALTLLIYAYFNGTRLRYVLTVCIVTFVSMAFWILPLAAFRHPYTTQVYMIWQDFVNLRYSLAGVLILILLIGPRYALHVVSCAECRKPLRDGMFISFFATGGFAAVYLFGAYLGYGSQLWFTGLHLPDHTQGIIGAAIGRQFEHGLIPFSIAVGAAVAGIGLYSRRIGSFSSFCRMAGAACFSAVLFLFSIGLCWLLAQAAADAGFHTAMIHRKSLYAVIGGLSLTALIFLGSSRRFETYLSEVADHASPNRFFMWVTLVGGCGVAYFSAHFLQVPDIRFLPPLGFALLMVLLAETLSPFFAARGFFFRTIGAVTLYCLVVIAALSGAEKSNNWYRYNNNGYERTSGYPEFAAVNRYLRTVYEKEGSDPLNAPRVGYEKCDSYGRYGGDRVFESLPFFSGRQTLEGIHYAGSIASRHIAFVQTEFSRDVKTPNPQVLSKINPEALPAHFDLYNLSQLVVMTDAVKRALSTSSHFIKEAQFGQITVYRYTACDGLYVDVPKVRPVLYTGPKWPDAFFEWHKSPQQSDVLLVADRFVKDPADRAVFLHSTNRVFGLETFRTHTLDRNGLRIETHLEDLRIRFVTNKVGVPHLIKVSYFPNWKVSGANGVYPVSPHLMLVIPRQPFVILSYERSTWEIIGLAITMGGFSVLIGWGLIRRLRFRAALKYGAPQKRIGQPYWESVERLSSTLRSPLLRLVAVLSALLIVSGAFLRNRPVRTYTSGFRAYKEGTLFQKEGKTEQAIGAFRKAISVMEPLLRDRARYDHRDVVNSLLFTAMCYENINDDNAAENWYHALLEEYPYSRYVGEANVKLARIYKNRMQDPWQKGMDKLKIGLDIQGQQLRLAGLELFSKSVDYYRTVFLSDPYSVWADYAVNDLVKEKKRLEEYRKDLHALPDDRQVKQRLGLLITRVGELIKRDVLKPDADF